NMVGLEPRIGIDRHRIEKITLHSSLRPLGRHSSNNPSVLISIVLASLGRGSGMVLLNTYGCAAVDAGIGYEA
ncbi:hypothetical protein LR032_00410, partial [Candidatus Bipolaricaulota bacterium]|nr:hypothetical protein [Candidatus Bipolaricaulota bacterium]